MLRHVLHAVVAALLWIVFVYYWRIVFQEPMNPDTKTALLSLAILTLAAVSFLGAWIFHNVRIHRRFGERRMRRREAPAPGSDFLGRRIITDDAKGLRRSTHIVVDVVRVPGGDGALENKVFKSVD
jgi:hypothetical protein